MVVLPVSADQPYSAERCADLGVARTLGAGAREPDAIRDAVREVLAEPSYRANARAFQQEMRALPGPEVMVALLESLPPGHEQMPGPPSRARPLPGHASPGSPGGRPAAAGYPVGTRG